MVRLIRRGSESAKQKRSKPAGDNGMATFAMHASVPAAKKTLSKLGVAAAAAAAPLAAAAPMAAAAPPISSLDPETAARYYLDTALDSPSVKQFSRPKAGAMESEFTTINTETVPLTGTTVVKFRQAFNKIPVYGSLVTVELDEQQECLGINSSLGAPAGVKPIAKIAPAAAVKAAAKAAGTTPAKVKTTPRLYYYYDQSASRWSLAYIIEDVPVKKREVGADGTGDAALKDYVIDAHNGKVIAALPRTPSVSMEDTALDGLRAKRTFSVEKLSGKRRELRNTTLNVTTYDFKFKDPTSSSNLLPGEIGVLPPPPWRGEYVSAHANAEEVARFLRLVVKRNNIDGNGGEMISSVNCWDKADGITPAKQWKNAYWNGQQMVYGQIRFPDQSFYSVANMLDVVAHEMFHGVTDRTSRLEYQAQSGALNESYSDIFGVLVANRGKPIANWNWKIATGFDGPNTALRDLQDPTREGQPKLMKDFQQLGPPYVRSNDYGGVHANSGIHNYAAYRIMSARSKGQPVFTADELAAMFYVALTVHLSRTSQFADSRRAVLQAAQSLFRNDPKSIQANKINAVKSGFKAAGIL